MLLHLIISLSPTCGLFAPVASRLVSFSSSLLASCFPESKLIGQKREDKKFMVSEKNFYWMLALALSLCCNRKAQRRWREGLSKPQRYANMMRSHRRPGACERCEMIIFKMFRTKRVREFDWKNSFTKFHSLSLSHHFKFLSNCVTYYFMCMWRKEFRNFLLFHRLILLAGPKNLSLSLHHIIKPSTTDRVFFN